MHNVVYTYMGWRLLWVQRNIRSSALTTQVRPSTPTERFSAPPLLGRGCWEWQFFAGDGNDWGIRMTYLESENPWMMMMMMLGKSLKQAAAHKKCLWFADNLVATCTGDPVVQPPNYCRWYQTILALRKYMEPAKGFDRQVTSTDVECKDWLPNWYCQ